MSVRIRGELCIGCGKCTEACPGNLIRLVSGEEGSGPEAAAGQTTGFSAKETAHIRHPEDCWGCTSCLKECPAGAIEFFLGADIGGRGTILTVCKTRDGWDWHFHHPSGAEETISVNAKAANRY